MVDPHPGAGSYALLTRPPLRGCKQPSVRLACVKHAASVHPEPGSNSPLDPQLIHLCLRSSCTELLAQLSLLLLLPPLLKQPRSPTEYQSPPLLSIGTSLFLGGSRLGSPGTHTPACLPACLPVSLGDTSWLCPLCFLSFPFLSFPFLSFPFLSFPFLSFPLVLQVLLCCLRASQSLGYPGFEPETSPLSGARSTTELIAPPSAAIAPAMPLLFPSYPRLLLRTQVMQAEHTDWR